MIILRSAPGAGVDYQILLKVGEDPLSTEAHFDVNSEKFPSGTDDSGDVRFTLIDGSVLPMWTEKVTGVTPYRTAYIWVKVTANLDDNVALFCYSGNPDAENVSNIDSVFIKVIDGVVFSLTNSLKDTSGNENNFQVHMPNPMQQVDYDYPSIGLPSQDAQWLSPYPQRKAPADPFWVIRPFCLDSPTSLVIDVSFDNYWYAYLDDIYLGEGTNWMSFKTYTVNADKGPHLLRIAGGNYKHWSPTGIICSVQNEATFRTHVSDHLWKTHAQVVPYGPTECDCSFAFAGGLVQKYFHNHSFKGEVTIDPWDVAFTGSIKIFASGYIDYCSTWMSPEESLEEGCRRLDLDAVEELMVFKCSDGYWYSLKSPTEHRCSNSEIDNHRLPYTRTSNYIQVDIPDGLAVEQICDVESVSLRCTADNEYNLDVAVEATPYNVQTGHYIKCNSTTGVSNTKMSMCVWYYPVDFKEETPLCYIRCTGTTSARFFYFSTWQSGGPHNSLHLGTLTPEGHWGRGVTSGTVLDSTRKWYFYSGVINNSIGKVTGYVNATQVASQTFATGPTLGTPTEIWIGGTPENYQWTNGFICKPIFFAKALTLEDIQLMYENTYYTTPHAPGKALIRKFVCPEPGFAVALTKLDEIPTLPLLYKARDFGLWNSMGVKQSLTYSSKSYKLSTLDGTDSEVPKQSRIVLSTTIEFYGIKATSFTIDDITTSLSTNNAVVPLFPFKTQLTASVPIESDTIYVMDVSEFEEGKPVILSSHRKGYEEYAYVIGKSDTALYLHRRLEHSYEVGDYAIPAIVGICKVRGRQSHMKHKVFVSKVEATERFPEWWFKKYESLSFEKFIAKPRVIKVASELIDKRSIMWPNSGRVSVSYPTHERITSVIEHNYVLVDPTWKELRKAFFYSKQRGEPVLVPTWQSDLEVIESAPSGAIVLKVSPSSYCENWEEHTRLLLDDGVNIQEVVVNGCTSYPTYCTVTLSDALQLPVPKGAVAHFLINTCFKEDSLSFSFIKCPPLEKCVCKTTVKWKEVCG